MAGLRPEIPITDTAITDALRNGVVVVPRAAIEQLVNTVHNLDATEFLGMFPDNSIDMIFTDEPYSVQPTVYVFNARKNMSSEFEWDKDLPASIATPWIYEAARTLKQGGHLLTFCIAEWITAIRDIGRDSGMRYRAAIPWIKTNPSPSVRRVNYRSAWEVLMWFQKGDSGTFNFQEQQEMRNWLVETTCPNCGCEHPLIQSNQYLFPEWQSDMVWHAFEISGLSNDRGRAHPTQKPEWLATKFITIHTNPGELLVDPFCGSGTIPYVARCMGRNAVANDASPEWAKHTEERMEHIETSIIGG